MNNTLVKDSLVADGTYTVVNGELVDYAAKWAFGYIVAKGSDAYGAYQTPSRVTVENVIAGAKAFGWSLFGVWVDPATGIQYIDPVEHIAALPDALTVARQRGEIAIYSLRDEVCVYL